MKTYGTKRILPVYGDSRPIERRINNVKIAGWKEVILTGESISQVDTYNDSAYLRIYGKSEQVQTTQGKNLFDAYNYVTSYPDDIKPVNQDGEDWIKMQSSTKQARYNFNAKENTQYTFTFEFKRYDDSGSYSANFVLYYTDGTSETLDFGYYGDGILHKVSKTSAQNKTISYIRNANNGNTVYFLLRVNGSQIEEGITATAYSPFVPNSPSPEYPSPIESVSGKNLFDGTSAVVVKSTGVNNYVNSENLTKGSSNVSGAIERLDSYDGYNNVIHIKQAVGWATIVNNIMSDYYMNNAKTNDYVTCLFLIKKSSSVNVATYFNSHTVAYYTVLTKYKDVDENWAYYYATYQFKNTATSFLPSFHFQTTGEIYIAKIQVTIGREPLDYEPYISSSVNIPLLHPLRSLPNGVTDRIYYSNGKWYDEQKIGEDALGLLNAWDAYLAYNSGGGVGYCYVVNNSNFSTGIQKSICTHFKNVNYVYLSSTGYIGAYCDHPILTLSRKYFISNIANLTDFKAWLTANNVRLQYELATPIITEITDTSTIEALDNINTYYPYTYISTESNIQPKLKGTMKIIDRGGSL